MPSSELSSEPSRAREANSRSSARRRWVILALVWGLAAFSSLPILFHWAARTPRLSRTTLALELGYAAAALICFCIYRIECHRLPRSQAFTLVFLVFLLNGFANHIHAVDVDYAPQSNDMSNVDWQKMVQNAVVQSDPRVLPHSYRFLPNGIVRWLERHSVSFEAARDLYRLLSGLLLFYAIYRYARLYTSHVGAILTMLFVSLPYPVSFEYYRGQLTDPLSHLSFVLAFIFLETEDFAFLFTTLLIGSLAKETVLCLTGYYILFRRKDLHYLRNAGLLAAVTIIAYFGVRLLVLQHGMDYQQVSGVDLNHIMYNIRDVRWPVPFLLTAGAYLPFLVLSWKRTPASLRNLALFLLVVLFASSFFLSWLCESRNYMPAVFVLALVAARYFIPEPDQDVLAVSSANLA